MIDTYVEAQKLAQIIGKDYQPEKIILFCSIARGNPHPTSDIDLLIIKNSKKKAYRIKEVFEAVRSINRHHPMDPLVITPEELEERISLGDYFIQRILKEGKIIYART